MNTTKFTIPKLHDYSPNRKLFSYLLLCHRLKKSFKTSISVPAPIPYRTFLSGSRKYVEKIIESDLVEPGATMLDILFKSGHKPVTLELRVPIASDKTWMIPCNPPLREKIEFLAYLGCTPKFISDQIAKDETSELYSAEEINSYLHLHFNLDPLDGWRSEYRRPLAQYWTNSKVLKDFYKPLIDLESGRIGLQQLLQLINCWDLVSLNTKRELYSTEAEAVSGYKRSILNKDLEKAQTYGKLISMSQKFIADFREISKDEVISFGLIPELEPFDPPKPQKRGVKK